MLSSSSSRRRRSLSLRILLIGWMDGLDTKILHINIVEKLKISSYPISRIRKERLLLLLLNIKVRKDDQYIAQMPHNITKLNKTEIN